MHINDNSFRGKEKPARIASTYATGEILEIISPPFDSSCRKYASLIYANGMFCEARCAEYVSASFVGVYDRTQLL